MKKKLNIIFLPFSVKFYLFINALKLRRKNRPFKIELDNYYCDGLQKSNSFDKKVAEFYVRILMK